MKDAKEKQYCNTINENVSVGQIRLSGYEIILSPIYNTSCLQMTFYSLF